MIRLVLCRVHDSLHLSNGTILRRGNRDFVTSQIRHAPYCVEIACDDVDCRGGNRINEVKLIVTSRESRRDLFRVGLRGFPDHQTTEGWHHQQRRYPDPLKVSKKLPRNLSQPHCRRPYDSNEWSHGRIDGVTMMDRSNQSWVGLLRCTLTCFNFGCFLATDGAFSSLCQAP